MKETLKIKDPALLKEGDEIMLGGLMFWTGRISQPVDFIDLHYKDECFSTNQMTAILSVAEVRREIEPIRAKAQLMNKFSSGSFVELPREWAGMTIKAKPVEEKSK